MFKNKQWKLKRLFLASLTILLGLVVIACAPPAPQAASGGAAAEVPTEQTEAAASGTKVTLEFWLPVGLEQINDVLKSQLEEFTQAHPTIAVEIIVQGSLLTKLETAVAAGQPPAVAALDNGVMHYLTFASQLQPLENLRDDDFLPGILDANTFNSHLYGLPWVRFGCTPRYLNLIGFTDHRHPEEAYALIKHLIQPEQQPRNYHAAGLWPTRQSAYTELGIECPPLREVLLPSPVDQERISTIVQERAPNLQPILDQNSQALMDMGLLQRSQTLNPFLATAAITYDEQFPDQETIDFEDPFEPTGTILTVAAPVMTNFSKEDFEKALLSESGVIVGAFFGVDGTIELNDVNEGSFPIESGKDYAVKWRAIDNLENVNFYLIDAGDATNEIFAGTITLLPTYSNIQPFVTIELGSCKVCWHGPDDRSGCKTFTSEKKAASFKKQKENEGATITKYVCN